MIEKFFKSENGATLVEYGVALILAISAGGVALITVGDQVGANMETACEVLRMDGVVEGNCEGE